MLSKRFWQKVTKTPECWVWCGAKQRGYGVVRIAGRTYPTHRVAYEALVGPIPHGLLVLHRCDTRNCVNPAHLWLGTQQDNMLDMVRKGRDAWRTHPESMRAGTRKHPPKTRPRGEQSKNARFTAADVQEMRRAYRAGETQQAIASRFGTAQAVISRIVLRTAWAHLP